MTKNLYDILGVDKTATKEEINRAYKEKAKKHHEDRGGDKERMAEINRAAMILRDPQRRERYDTTGKEDKDSFDQEFMGYVNTLFLNIIENNNVDTSDLIGLFREHTQRLIDGGYQTVKDTKRRIKKLEKVLKRLGDSPGIFGQVVVANIYQYKKDVVTHEEQIKFFERCLDKIKDNVYSYEPGQDVSWHFINLQGS